MIGYTANAKWIVPVVVAAGLVLTGATAASAEGERLWRVSDIKGSALVRIDGEKWTTLKRGDKVVPGTDVKTGTDGRIIMVRPGDSLDVAPNSYFNIPVKGQAGAKKPATHILQKMGTILFKITTRPDNPFTVQTPYLAAVIKGTTFTVSVDSNDAALHVSKGAVQVSSILSGQTALVRPGQTAAVSASKGGHMRLIGVKNRTAPANKSERSQEQTVVAGATNGVKSKAGRGSVARSVIPRAIGQKRLNIELVSRGLVNDSSANASKRSMNSRSDPGKTPNAKPMQSTARTAFGRMGINKFSGRSNGKAIRKAIRKGKIK